MAWQGKVLGVWRFMTQHAEPCDGSAPLTGASWHGAKPTSTSGMRGLGIRPLAVRLPYPMQEVMKLHHAEEQITEACGANSPAHELLEHLAELTCKG